MGVNQKRLGFYKQIIDTLQTYFPIKTPLQPFGQSLNRIARAFHYRFTTIALPFHYDFTTN